MEAEQQAKQRRAYRAEAPPSRPLVSLDLIVRRWPRQSCAKAAGRAHRKFSLPAAWPPACLLLLFETIELAAASAAGRASPWSISLGPARGLVAAAAAPLCLERRAPTEPKAAAELAPPLVRALAAKCRAGPARVRPNKLKLERASGRKRLKDPLVVCRQRATRAQGAGPPTTLISANSLAARPSARSRGRRSGDAHLRRTARATLAPLSRRIDSPPPPPRRQCAALATLDAQLERARPETSLSAARRARSLLGR